MLEVLILPFQLHNMILSKPATDARHNRLPARNCVQIVSVF